MTDSNKDVARCGAICDDGVSICGKFVNSPGQKCRHHDGSERSKQPSKGIDLDMPESTNDMVNLLAQVAVAVAKGNLTHLEGQAIAAIGRAYLSASKHAEKKDDGDEIDSLTAEELSKLLKK